MSTLRLLAFAALIAFALAPAPADDSKPAPAPDRLVIRAKLPVPPTPPVTAATAGTPAAPPRPEAPSVTVDTDEATPRSLTAAVTVGDGGAVEAVVSAANLGVSGRIMVRPAGGARGFVLAFRDDLRGEVDLGTIAFGDQCPALVTGRVETPQKKPVAGATVNVRFQISAWATLKVSDTAATTGADGAFTIRADVRDRRGVMFVETEGRWRTVVPMSLLKPAKDVRLVAAATTEVTGRIEVPEGLDLMDLVVVVSGAPLSFNSARTNSGNFTKHSGDSDWMSFPAYSPFVLTGLAPGRYDLRLKFRDATRALADLPDVDVTEATADLPPLKVDVPVRRVGVRVVGSDGAALAGATVWVREKGDRGKFRAVRAGADGVARVAFVGDEASLAAHAPGTSWAFADAKGADVSLSVERLRGTPVRMILPDKALRGGGAVEVAVTLTWRADPEIIRSAVASARDATDPRETEVVELPFPLQDPPEGLVTLPGWYEVGFRVRRGDRSVSRALESVRIAGDELRVIALEMSAEQINEVVRSMSGD